MAWHLSSSPTTDGFAAGLPYTSPVSSKDNLLPGDALVWPGHMEMFARWKNTGNHAAGAYTYSLNGPAGQDWAKGPTANNHGQVGDASAGDLDSATKLRYTKISRDGAVTGGVLHHVYADTSGWHDGLIGFAVGKISAVNMGGQWPQVMTVVGGRLHQIYGDTTGWHDGNTGLPVPDGSSISAVNMGGQWPQVMANRTGVLNEIYADSTGWHS